MPNLSSGAKAEFIFFLLLNNFSTFIHEVNTQLLKKVIDKTELSLDEEKNPKIINFMRKSQFVIKSAFKLLISIYWFIWRTFKDFKINRFSV